MKKKSFWIFLTSTVLTVLFFVLGILRYPSYSALNNFERGINQNNISKLLKSYVPESREEMQPLMMINQTLNESDTTIADFFGFDIKKGETLKLLYSLKEKDDDRVVLNLFYTIHSKDKTLDAYCEDIELYLLNGKYYLEY